MHQGSGKGRAPQQPLHSKCGGIRVFSGREWPDLLFLDAARFDLVLVSHVIGVV